LIYLNFLLIHMPMSFLSNSCYSILFLIKGCK
jgi:hypothetical protein